MKYQFDKVKMISTNGHTLRKSIKYGWMLKLDNIEILSKFHNSVHRRLIKRAYDDHRERLEYNRKTNQNVTGHWSSNPAIALDALISSELLMGNDISLLGALIKYETLLLSSKMNAINKGHILYVRRNGVATPFNVNGMVVEDTMIKNELIYPQEGKIKVFKWPGGKHYYATFDGNDVVYDGAQKWSTRKTAKFYADLYRRKHYGKIDEIY